MPYRRILVAIDPQTSSTMIVAYAGALAKRLHSELVITTAIPDLRALYNGPESSLQSRFDAELIDQARQQLERLCQQTHIKVDKILVLRGDADQVISAEAEKHDYDLVIFGNHDRHGLDHYVGDFGLGLLHRTHCDLLAVHTGKQTHSVSVAPVVAIGNDGQDADICLKARALHPEATLQFIHVVRSAWFEYVLDNPLFTLSTADKRIAEQAIRQSLLPLTERFSPSELTLKFGTPSEELEQFSVDGGHSLIIMGSGSHSGIGWRVGSTANNLLSRTKANVLLIRPTR